MDYWVRRSGLTRPRLEETLKEHGIRVGSHAQRISKNSLRRLRRIFDAPLVIRVEEPAPEPLPKLRWEAVGQERQCRALEVGEVRAIHEALEEDFFRSADLSCPREWPTRAYYRRQSYVLILLCAALTSTQRLRWQGPPSFTP